ncbi:MAG: hypothetical protein J5J00_00555 [Deltaproteobacteria bacterium]|nr:hypothetical protein [Deltaproteobacteria bacterium]
MACYQCGSPEGNEARLCPACTEKRLAQKRQDREAEMRPRRPDTYEPELPPEPYSLTQRALFAGGSSLFAGAVVWLFFFSVYGPGWGMSRAEHAYKKCLHAVSGMNAAPKDSGNEEVDKAFAAFGESLMQGLGTAVCEGLRDECSKNPDGEACSAIARAL